VEDWRAAERAVDAGRVDARCVTARRGGPFTTLGEQAPTAVGASMSSVTSKKTIGRTSDRADPAASAASPAGRGRIVGKAARRDA
jgi:hypothetical protein